MRNIEMIKQKFYSDITNVDRHVHHKKTKKTNKQFWISCFHSEIKAYQQRILLSISAKRIFVFRFFAF